MTSPPETKPPQPFHSLRKLHGSSILQMKNSNADSKGFAQPPTDKEGEEISHRFMRIKIEILEDFPNSPSTIRENSWFQKPSSNFPVSSNHSPPPSFSISLISPFTLPPSPFTLPP